MAAIIKVDRSGIITYWNAAAEQLFGFAELEAIGNPLELIIPQPSHACHRQGFASYIESSVKTLPDTVTAVGRHKDGRLVRFEISTKAVVDAEGTLAGVEGLIRAN